LLHSNYVTVKFVCFATKKKRQQLHGSVGIRVLVQGRHTRFLGELLATACSNVDCFYLPIGALRFDFSHANSLGRKLRCGCIEGGGWKSCYHRASQLP